MYKLQLAPLKISPYLHCYTKWHDFIRGSTMIDRFIKRMALIDGLFQLPKHLHLKWFCVQNENHRFYDPHVLIHLSFDAYFISSSVLYKRGWPRRFSSKIVTTVVDLNLQIKKTNGVRKRGKAFFAKILQRCMKNEIISANFWTTIMIDGPFLRMRFKCQNWQLLRNFFFFCDNISLKCLHFSPTLMAKKICHNANQILI